MIWYSSHPELLVIMLALYIVRLVGFLGHRHVVVVFLAVLASHTACID